ncbi:MAG: hypothetical protein LAT62_11550 [Natronospirillum sp.]|uniref:ribosome modulation factor n=1 Tax=Natronospirillum sp. TaxID=2812955 RepID=UPI0025D279CD|nr:ribosome modulation factor [Natronospirillum sp.]MCH8552565.1 hypothetical protein [Natronospirillum sp.]
MSQSKWSLERLNEAYRKGYFVGLSGRQRGPCPYEDEDVLASAWEAGWHDGNDAVRIHRARPAASPGSTDPGSIGRAQSG